jgi:predicted translin family RNA/ssDNA-binding protein
MSAAKKSANDASKAEALRLAKQLAKYAKTVSELMVQDEWDDAYYASRRANEKADRLEYIIGRIVP